MSIRIMTAVWDLQLPDSEKLVLLALADNANDDGHCWPGMKTLVRKCSKSDRTIQASIKSLCDAGHLTRTEVPGKGCRYVVHPQTPEAASPPKLVRETPEAASGKPSLNHQSSIFPRAWDCPIGVEPQVWADFLTNRKKKGLPNTETSWKALQATLERIAASSGILPTALIEHAAGAGWGGIYDPTGRSNGNGQGYQHRAAAGKSAAAYHALTAHLGDNEAF